MKARASVGVAWALAVAAAILAAVGFGYAVASWHAPLPAQAFGFRGFPTLLAVEFAVSGLILATKRPTNPIGWLFLAGAVASGLQELSDGYAIWAVQAHGSTAALARIAAVGEDWIWLLGFGSLALALPLFPDGRTLSRRWGLWVTICAVGTAVSALAYVFTAKPLIFHGIDNPLAVPGMYEVAMGAIVFFILLLLTGFVSLAIRLRRTTGDEHEQMKWLAYSAGLILSAFVAYFIVNVASGGNSSTTVANVMETLIVVGVMTVPVAIGIGIMKYRLYDIDVVINKTLVYGALGVFITLIYVGIVVGIGAVVGTRSNSVLSAVAAAVVALAFQPARRRAQHLANRLVYGKRATPYEVLSELSTRFAGTYSLEDALPRLARLVADSTGARKTVVWLRVGRELRPDAVWPSQEPEPSITLDDDELPALGDHSAEVRHQGELLGAVSIAMPPGETLTPASEKLLRDAAAQAGLVLRNVALVEDLRASRRRIVTAQDDRAKTLERNIHDGAQQQLVALSVKHRLLAGMIGTDDDRARAMVEQLLEDTNDALQNLRDLARGIYPPLLADKGLPDALVAQARKIAVPIEISANGAGRYPQEVEAAVYFCVLEALQNVTKYANASKTTVRIEAEDGLLTFVVEDDGGGFDPQATSQGTGLQGMADRLEALGGSLRVDSHPGAGTTVIGTVPV